MVGWRPGSEGGAGRTSRDGVTVATLCALVALIHARSAVGPQPPARASRPPISISRTTNRPYLRSLPAPPPPTGGGSVSLPTLVLNASMNESWWTGVALLAGVSDAEVMVSVGNWYAPPYAFHVQALPLGTCSAQYTMLLPLSICHCLSVSVSASASVCVPVSLSLSSLSL